MQLIFQIVIRGRGLFFERFKTWIEYFFASLNDIVRSIQIHNSNISKFHKNLCWPKCYLNVEVGKNYVLMKMLKLLPLPRTSWTFPYWLCPRTALQKCSKAGSSARGMGRFLPANVFFHNLTNI